MCLSLSFVSAAFMSYIHKADQEAKQALYKLLFCRPVNIISTAGGLLITESEADGELQMELFRFPGVRLGLVWWTSSAAAAVASTTAAAADAAASDAVGVRFIIRCVARPKDDGRWAS